MNPFATPAMAAGYAADRPPMHARIVKRIRQDLAARVPVDTVLDVGCGAGLSTIPLHTLGGRRLGIEPVEAMAATARGLVPDASFFVASAERLPLPDRCIDVATAAGSLNFMRVDDALREIRRVLRLDGVLVAYDWATAREFADDDGLTTWFATFATRYPRPPSEAVPLDPTILERRADGYRLTDSLTFAWPLSMTAEAYARYMLTETRVAAAIRAGEPREAIAAWCHRTLADVFGGRTRDVLFRGYIAYLRPALT